MYVVEEVLPYNIENLCYAGWSLRKYWTFQNQGWICFCSMINIFFTGGLGCTKVSVLVVLTKKREITSQVYFVLYSRHRWEHFLCT